MKTKSLVSAVLVLALLCGLMGSCLAEILAPYGEGQIGRTAVVLCDSLTIREGRSTSSRSVKSLRYGDRLIVQHVIDGWADCFLSDAVDAGSSGWVNADYIAIDPAWYRTEASTAVYAWNSTAAPKVALLSKGTVLPVLRDAGDWVVVSLRGASGWIRKTALDRAGYTYPGQG